MTSIGTQEGTAPPTGLIRELPGDRSYTAMHSMSPNDFQEPEPPLQEFTLDAKSA